MTKLNCILLLAALVLNFPTSFCQNKKIDSLQFILKNAKEDTNKVNTLYEFCTALINESDLELAQQKAKESLFLSEKLGFEKGKAGANGLLGVIHLSRGEYNLSLLKHNEALRIRKGVNDKRGMALSYSNIARVYSYQDNYPIAIQNFILSLKFAEELKDSALIIYIIREIGESYGYQEDYVNQKKYYDLALKYINKSTPVSSISGIYIRLADISLKFGDHDKAYELAEAALKLDQEVEDIRAISYDFLILAKVYEMRWELSAAKGNTEDAGKNYSKALFYFLECEKKFDLADTTLFNLGALSDFYADFGAFYIKHGNFNKAEEYINKSLELSIQLNWFDNLKNSYNALYRLDSAKNGYKQAFDNYKLFTRYKDSLNNKKNLAKAEGFRIQYEFDKKTADSEAEQLKINAQVQRTKNLQYTAIGVFLLLTVFLFINNRQKQKSKTKVEKAYKMLSSTQAQLIQREKMASLGELTAGIAHEIQNPLNFVNNFSELNTELIAELKDEIENGNIEDVKNIANDVAENEQKIYFHGKRASDIVNGMLQHSRSSSGFKELTDINSLVDEYLRLAYHGLRAKDKSFHASMNTDFDKSIGNIKIIPQDIGRVILNIVTNAFYAVMHKRNNLSSHNIGLPYEPIVIVTTKKVNKKVEIRISDNGNGIPEKILDKIFQPFFTTKPTGEGTGLGLSMSYDIIKAHNGELIVESKEGERTEFIIQLPVIE